MEYSKEYPAYRYQSKKRLSDLFGGLGGELVYALKNDALVYPVSIIKEDDGLFSICGLEPIHSRGVFFIRDEWTAIDCPAFEGGYYGDNPVFVNLVESVRYTNLSDMEVYQIIGFACSQADLTIVKFEDE